MSTTTAIGGYDKEDEVKKVENQTVELSIRIVPVGESYLAVTVLGGMTVKGRLTDSRKRAVQSLFSELSGNTEDAQIGLELHLSGSSLGELTSGE